MIAMLLAAGRGVRMQPLTVALAKPAIPLLGEPMIAHGLRALARGPVRAAVVNLHHRPDDVVRAVGDPVRLGLGEVRWSHEEDRLLGTAGGLRHAADHLRGEGTIVVRNGDFLADIDLAGTLAAHRASGLPATMVVTAPRPGYTPVPVSTEGRVIGFGDDAPRRGRDEAGRYTFTGLHVLEEELLDRIPGGPSDLVGALYRDLASEDRLGAVVHHGFWWEFGTPETYRDGVLRLLALGGDERAAVLRHDPVSSLGAARVAVGAAARWADGVEWSGGIALGAGCEVGRRARLADTVLLPGCRVGRRASLRGCIVGPGTRIPDGARFDDVLICRVDPPDDPLPDDVTRIDDLLIRPLGGSPP